MNNEQTYTGPDTAKGNWRNRGTYNRWPVLPWILQSKEEKDKEGSGQINNCLTANCDTCSEGRGMQAIVKMTWMKCIMNTDLNSITDICWKLFSYLVEHNWHFSPVYSGVTWPPKLISITEQYIKTMVKILKSAAVCIKPQNNSIMFFHFTLKMHGIASLL